MKNKFFLKFNKMFFFHYIFILTPTNCPRIYVEGVQKYIGPKLNLKNIWENVLNKKIETDHVWLQLGN